MTAEHVVREPAQGGARSEGVIKRYPPSNSKTSTAPRRHVFAIAMSTSFERNRGGFKWPSQRRMGHACIAALSRLASVAGIKRPTLPAYQAKGDANLFI